MSPPAFPDAQEKSPPPDKGRPQDALPHVDPPGAGFILQLFLIPMFIVVIIISVWLTFSWLAHMGSDPRELVKDIAKGDDYGWQKAATLADLLRNREYEHLKSDPALAKELAAVLTAQIDAGNKDKDKDAAAQRMRLEIFLCRALGEFYIDDGLPALLKAATVQRSEEEIAVRRSAIEAIAVLARNAGAEKFRDRPEVLEALREAAQARSPSGADADHAYADLRSTAAFALGVVGGPEALDRLEFLLSDSYANARYNAATGLARHGDERCVGTLLEMLDPENEAAVADEVPEGMDFKRSLVQKNGLTGVEQLHDANPQADLSRIKAQLEELQSADVPAAVRQRAAALLNELKRDQG